MPRLTDDQTKALSLDRNISVSAGAGSGKTGVLVQRYLRILQKYPELSPVSVVAITFTRKAAGELKEKIQRAVIERLNEIRTTTRSPEWKRWEQVRIDLHRAPIGTIHSFAAQILREYPIESGIDPDFEVMEESGGTDPSFLAASEIVTGSRTDPLLSVHLEAAAAYFSSNELVNLLASWISDPLLQKKIRVFASTEPLDEVSMFNTVISAGISRTALQNAVDNLRMISGLSVKGMELCSDLIEATDNVKNMTAQTWLERLIVLLGRLFTQSNSPRKFTNYPSLELVAGKLQAQFESFLEFKSFNPATEISAQQLAEHLSVLADAGVVRLKQLRREKCILSFNDLEYYAGLLLNESEHRDRICRELQRKYRFFMIDEFQDTNEAQWRIIRPIVSDRNAVLPDRLFIVGDAKQSIYRFRGADVDVFRRVSDTIEASNTTSGCSIHELESVKSQPHITSDDREKSGRIRLNRNFRSARKILELTDWVFSRLMCQDMPCEIPYESLTPHRTDEGETGIVLFDRSLDEPGEPYEWAILMGRHIRNLVESKKAEFGDITVLIPRRTRLLELEMGLRSENVPFIVYKGIGYWDRPEINELISLIAWFSDPGDRVALYTVLRSPCFGLSLEGLILLNDLTGADFFRDRPVTGLRDLDMEILEKAKIILKKYLDCSGRMPLSVVLEDFLASVEAWSAYRATEDGVRKVSNIEKFIDIITQYEKEGIAPLQALAVKLKQLSESVREGEEISGESMSDQVRIMTVHAAKGLEFKVVYIAGLEGKPPGSNTFILVDDELGVGFRLPACNIAEDSSTTWMYEKIKKKTLKQMDAEDNRLLYVSMTRAMDRLYLVFNRRIDRNPPVGSWAAKLNGIIPLPDPGEVADRIEIVTASGTPVQLPLLMKKSGPAVMQKSRKDPGSAFRSIDLFPSSAVPLDRARELAYPAQKSIRKTIGVTELEFSVTHRNQYYRRYILNLPEHYRSASAQSSADLSLVTGIVFHEILERNLNMTDSERERFIEEVAWRYEVEAPDLDIFSSRLRRSLQNHRSWDRWKTVMESENYAERPFAFDCLGTTIEGIYDRIYRHNGIWTIVDFKTDQLPGGLIPEPQWLETHARRHEFQMKTYALALYRAMASRQESIDAVLYFSDPGDEYVFSFTREELSDWSRYIEEIIQSLPVD